MNEETKYKCIVKDCSCEDYYPSEISNPRNLEPFTPCICGHKADKHHE